MFSLRSADDQRSQNKSNEYKKVEQEKMARLRLNPKMSPFLMSALPMQN